ncbi:MAG: FHA domain-containing protein [Planctomycetes bacterium]|nr:FHA domain-containing protein [Planctomycetota bacterium]
MSEPVSSARVFLLNEKYITIGRSQKCAIVLEGENISRTHTIIEQKKDGWWVLDAESRNGTFVNVNKIQSHCLQHNDIIKVGDFGLKFLSAGKPVAEVLIQPFSAYEAELRERFAPPAQEKPAVKYIEIPQAKSDYLFGAAMVIFLVLFFAGGIFSYLVYKDYSKASLLYQQFDEAVNMQKSGHYQKAKGALAVFLASYPNSFYTDEVRAHLAQVEEKLAAIDSVRVEFESIGAMTKGQDFDPVVVRDAYQQFATNHPESAFVTQAREKISYYQALIDKDAVFEFKKVLVRVEDALAEFKYNEAIQHLDKFASNYKVAIIGEDAFNAQRKGILDKAAEDFGKIVKTADKLIKDRRYPEAESFYRKERPRFYGTPFYYEIEWKLDNIASVSGNAKTTAGADKKITDARAVIAKAEDYIKSLCRESKFEDALREYEATLASIGSDKDVEPLRKKFEVQYDYVRFQAGLFRKMMDAVNQKKMANLKFPVRNKEGVPVKASSAYLEVSIGTNITVNLAWDKLEPGQLVALYENSKLTSDELFYVASYCFASNLSEKGSSLLKTIVDKAPEKSKEIYNYLSYLKKTPVPEKGFVYYEENWYTPEEYKAALVAEKGDKMVKAIMSESVTKENIENAFKEYEKLAADPNAAAQYKADLKGKMTNAFKEKRETALQRVKKIANATEYDKLKALKEELNKRRAEALKVIFDKTIYPDEDHGRVGQPKVDEKVNAVKEIWNNPLSVILTISPDVNKAMELVRVIDGCLKSLGVEVKTDEELNSILALGTGKIGLANFSLNAVEAGILEYNKKVLQANNEAVTAMSLEEMQVLKVTNEYREMMGLRLLGANDLLAKAAKKHIEWCARRNNIDHIEDTPGRRTPGDRAVQEGYAGGVGENLAQGTSTPEASFLGWYNSSGHHRNMLMAEWAELGVGQVGVFWCQVFGAGGTAVLNYPKKEDGK